MSDKKVICCTHADCFDGMGAAWAVYKRFPEAEFHFMDYKDNIDFDLDDSTLLIITDFSFDLDTMMALWERCGRMVFLDHHPRSANIVEYMQVHCIRENPKLGLDSFIYDDKQSGAVMAWMFFHSSFVPKLLQHIGDRDLWQFALPDTKEIMAGLGLTPLNLNSWIEMFDDFHGRSLELCDLLKQQGEIVLLKEEADITRIIDQTLRYLDIFGYENVPVINCPRSHTSEALARLAKDHCFAVGYYDTSTHRYFSLRSRGADVADVKEIAEFHGGGGHRTAAGCKVRRDHEWAKL